LSAVPLPRPIRPTRMGDDILCWRIMIENNSWFLKLNE
jgi:hypothetical protein